MGEYIRPDKVSNIVDNLRNAHDRLETVISSIKAEQYIKNAQKLQNFLQQVKAYKITSLAGAEDIALIYDSLETLQKQKGSRFTNLINNLFERQSKQYKGENEIFESELALVIEAVALSIAKDKDFIIRQDFHITQGNAKATIQAMPEQMCEHVRKKIAQVSHKKISKALSAKELLAEKDQKIDIDSNELSTITIQANANKSLQEIFNILKEATITAKNYSSMSVNGFVKGVGLIKTNNGRTTLHLGNTNLYKSLYGPLQYIGYHNGEHKDIEQLIYSGLTVLSSASYSVETQKQVSTHFFHLRFTYELMGTGLINQQKQSKIAEYLIYNDPSRGGDTIWVQSTRALVLLMIDKNKTYTTAQALGDITLLKQIMENKA